jgi:hypothetical protein
MLKTPSVQHLRRHPETASVHPESEGNRML